MKEGLIIGVMKESDKSNMALICKKATDKEIGSALADITSLISKKHPDAIKEATRILEEVSYD